MEDLVLIGIVRKVRGNKGDLKVQSMSDVPGRFEGLNDVFLRKHGSSEVAEYEVEKSELISDYVVMKFDGVNSYETASSLLGMEVLVRESERATPEAGTYFVDSLLGINVKDLSGKKIGIVKDVLSNVKQDILLIKMENGTEFELPFVDAFIKNVNIEAKEISIELIEGIVPEAHLHRRRMDHPLGSAADIEGGADED